MNLLCDLGCVMPSLVSAVALIGLVPIRNAQDAPESLLSIHSPKYSDGDLEAWDQHLEEARRAFLDPKPLCRWSWSQFLPLTFLLCGPRETESNQEMLAAKSALSRNVAIKSCQMAGGREGLGREYLPCPSNSTCWTQVDTRKPQCSHGRQEPWTVLGFLPITGKSLFESHQLQVLFVVVVVLQEVSYFKISGFSQKNLKVKPLWWFQWETTGSSIWILGPLLVALLGEVGEVDPCWRKWALRAYRIAPLLVCSLFVLVNKRWTGNFLSLPPHFLSYLPLNAMLPSHDGLIPLEL